MTSLLNPAALPERSQSVLRALVMAFPGKGRSALLKLLRQAGTTGLNGKLLDEKSLQELLEPLQTLGWIERLQRPEGQYLCVPAQRRNKVLLSLLESPERERLLREVAQSLPPLAHQQMPSLQRVLQELWLSLLLGDAEALATALYHLNAVFGLAVNAEQHPVQLLLNDEDGRSVFALLDRQTRQLLLEDHLELCNHSLAPSSQSYALALEALEQQPNQNLALQLLLQALWRSDWPVFDRLGQYGLELMQQSIMLILRGEVAEALQILRSWLAALRKQTGKRRIDLPPVLNAFYCLALFGENDPAQYPALKQALSLGAKENYGAAYPVLQQFLEQLQGGKPPSSSSLGKPSTGLDELLLALGLYWLDAPLARTADWCARLQEKRDRLGQLGYRWLAAEFDALIAAQFGTPRQLADVHPNARLQPLAALHQRQEAWQLALLALSQIKRGKAGVVQSEEKPARVAWFIRHGSYDTHVEPREQKRGAKGQWSKGRTMALKRLLEEGDSLDFLNEQDRQASRMIQTLQGYYGGNQYELPAALALPRLAGHPALYWHDAPDVRIDLQLAQPSLHLRVHEGQIHLRLEPRAVAQAQDIYLFKETPTRLLVYPISRELRQIASIVGDGLNVPQSAKAQLIDAVSAIAPLLPIHSDIPELVGHLDSEPADTRIYAHLLPLQAGVRLQLLVRPLADGSWFRPGQGAESLLGERDGKALQVSRDLAAERRAMEQVLQACPGLAEADSDGQEWQLEEPQAALQVLSELHALDGNLLQCVWPEGERMRIKARPSLSQLRLGLKQQGDWFTLQGEIQLEDGKVLQLRQLLELLKASPGRFLKLDEHDWLALDDRLRKRLDELAHLAERVSDQGLRLSPLTTPLLASLAKEAGEFAAGKEWQSHLDRLESLRHYQPQVPRGLQAQLRDYQHDGFVWLARLAQWGVGACLADDMGLGKTVQTLALLLQRAALGPQLVVAPTSVTLNWQAECSRFAPSLRLRIYQQERSLQNLGPGDLLIVSYGLLQQDSDAFAEPRWSSVVLDEAQAIKNAQTKRTQAVMRLQADFRLIATGTPVENHLGELWSLFRFINPSLLGSQEGFASRFATPIENGDAAARRALKALIQPFILRRLKSQVLDELPARTEITYKVTLSDDEKHQYEALRQQALESLSQLAPEQGKSFQVLAEITRLRRFCCHPSLVFPGSTLAGSKLRGFTAIVDELLENRHKALVFSQFVDHLTIVRNWLDQRGIAYQYLDGATPAKERQNAVNAFQAGVGDIFLISLKAGGSGLNLTAADYVIHLDPWWNPAVEDQASDRAHRMGQTRPVTIYRLVAENTIEEQIVALHGRKRDLADSLLEGGEVSARLDADALLQLLRG